MNEIFLVAGARPNFMKVAPILAGLRREGLPFRLIHTGQHYDPELSERIMQDLSLPEPDHHLGVGAGGVASQTARILEGMDDLLARSRPRAVVVVGDVTSSFAAALAAANREVPVVHVEAGLRSRDWSMPEERNRVLIDRLASLLFVTEPAGVTNLEEEGIRRGVHQVGNVMIDSLLQILPRARESHIQTRLEISGPYSVLTVHRPGNTDDAARFRGLIDAIAPLASQTPLIFPVHPRTRSVLDELELPPGFRCIDPLGYCDFIGLVADSSLVMTDSGGLQEETTVLGIPCMTLRPNTERPITIEKGTNVLVDLDAERIQEMGRNALRGKWKEGTVPELWDGRAAERLVKILVNELP